MSAEGKKKRGESGQSNAKNIAFRYGGRTLRYEGFTGSNCDYSNESRHASSRCGAGSLLVRAMALSDMLSVKYPATISVSLALKTEQAMMRCTHPSLSLRAQEI
jgi:hypothetical protein